ncbi:acetyl/propionyl/methylcrotonyl-CoA carboxylase subunit alpha [Bifidobacterium bombi]|uniref:biotin carboxylase n=1 Tax=Bifidobacterium bombi DSM 19703 TaxID=1341695 RepID=A0A080N2I2_9BIFI|nr:biotin carboxylase N-terminal domain-containing protein [Bifidobacterium bombi]KFF31187.1 carbamoyl-phosphate synthase L chain [Bifidobacterium bombi DSM 19703]
MNKLLIANRGEIALRVVRTAQEMGIATVAVYANQDRDAAYVQMADEAYLLPGETNNQTYLNEDAILRIAKRSGADAIHPGYGFLSEVSSFASKVEQAGITWVGPGHQVLTDLGDKIEACKVALKAKVPVVPGLNEPVRDIRSLLDFAQHAGYPVMMKKADGGGGRGITLIHDDEELRTFFMNHDALQGGDLDSYFIEKFVSRARHVETQSGRDANGGFTVYSTRDCSVQRRNQKLIEEAPAPYLSYVEISNLEEYSRRLFEAVGYVGLGTCEFLLTPLGKIYFLEVNPRLQVEHTVSEEVCGLDLVREQLIIASGGPLTPAPTPRGHAFELRITSEDPATNLTPSSGTIESLRWPSGPGIRIDSGVDVGDTVSPRNDSMMGKVVVTAQTREAAVARVRRALREISIKGVPTPVELFKKVFSDPDFTAEEGHTFNISTKWLENEYLKREPQTTKAGQPASASGNEDDDGDPVESFTVEIDDKRVKVTLPQSLVHGVSGLDCGGTRATSRLRQPLRGQGMKDRRQRPDNDDPARSGRIVAPMQAVVTRIQVAPGQEVDKSDLLVVLESMKMENYVYAPAKGKVRSINVGVADGVEAGQTLVELDLGTQDDVKVADAGKEGAR